MHGTLFDQRWLIEQADEGYVRLRGRLEPRWPFPGWAIQEISLASDRLDLRIEVHTSDMPFPATAGWHPWFRRRLAIGGSLVVGLDAARWYPQGRDGLPLGSAWSRRPRAARGTTASPPSPGRSRSRGRARSR